MIYNIAFIIVGVTWFVVMVYLQGHLNGLVILINGIHPLKNKKNPWKVSRQISRIQKEADNDLLKKLANEYSYYARLSLLALVVGFVLMIIIGTLNAWQNAIGNYIDGNRIK